MKKISILGCISAALLSLSACDSTDNGTGYQGMNYIQLTPENGKVTLLGEEDTPITVNVNLASALDRDLELEFTVDGPANVLEVTGNPVMLRAGAKTASFTISVASSEGLPKVTNYKVGLSAEMMVSENVALDAPLSFSVLAVDAPEITDQQQTILSAYQQATQIDLSKYLGLVDVEVEYTGFDNENQVPLDPVTFTGKTLISLSESSTADAPVLKMEVNAMGIQDKMYAALRAITVDDKEYWCDFESYPDNGNLVKATGWTSYSNESFIASLDGITFNADGTIEYLGTRMDQYEYEEVTVVPFEYYFTAYKRELAAIENGVFVKEEEYSTECTANPTYHLNHNDISSDVWEGGNWIEPTATITNEALTFTFCLYMSNNDYDYTRVIATYTPNN